MADPETQSQPDEEPKVAPKEKEVLGMYILEILLTKYDRSNS